MKEIDSVWPQVEDLLKQAHLPVRLIPASPGSTVHEELELTQASVLGAIAANAGAIVFDHGWLRVLGAGVHSKNPDDRLSSLSQANPDLEETEICLIAFDVLGGMFAIDDGGIGNGDGEVFYFAPDTLMWEGLELGYAQFIEAMVDGESEQFYADQRWPGWEKETEALLLGQGFNQYPFPFTDGGQDVSQVQRSVASLKDLHEFYTSAAMEREN